MKLLSILTTDELLDETKDILDRNIAPFFDEAICKENVTDQLKPKQKEIEKILNKKVKFLKDEDQEDDDDEEE
ncbi:MAG TPA: hypothetical protein VFI70_07595 [Nitrososphaeraceae archaeon]|nr:hypothetical protein [Nitrososphaeraceae archaeon]